MNTQNATALSIGIVLAMSLCACRTEVVDSSSGNSALGPSSPTGVRGSFGAEDQIAVTDPETGETEWIEPEEGTSALSVCGAHYVFDSGDGDEPDKDGQLVRPGDEITEGDPDNEGHDPYYGAADAATSVGPYGGYDSGGYYSDASSDASSADSWVDPCSGDAGDDMDAGACDWGGDDPDMGTDGDTGDDIMCSGGADGDLDADCSDATADAGSEDEDDEKDDHPACVPVEGSMYGVGSERYAEYTENEFIGAAEDNLATFSLDVDTASYSVGRRDLRACQLPVAAGVRVEEYLNVFDYGYRHPAECEDMPFSIHYEVGPSYFGEEHYLLQVGIQAATVGDEERLPANLVFLVDVSGSMSEELPLAQVALRYLVKALDGRDTLSIVTYASSTSVRLEPTPVTNRTEIYAVIDSLTAGGGTAGGAGIQLAYDKAREAHVDEGINRVVLCTDGDFNVGIQGDPLVEFVEAERIEHGTALTILGFGYGNIRDDYMEELTNAGDGNYAYIDGRNAAIKAATEDVVGTLQIVARDLKVQVEVNPELVRRYRIIGYDNRILEDWQFDDDTIDAADIGAGQDLTALLELELFAPASHLNPNAFLAQVNLRYKQPGETVSELIQRKVAVREIQASFEDTGEAFRFATAVAEFAEILRGGRYSSGSRYSEVMEILTPLADDAPELELIELIEAARRL